MCTAGRRSDGSAALEDLPILNRRRNIDGCRHRSIRQRSTHVVGAQSTLVGNAVLDPSSILTAGAASALTPSASHKLEMRASSFNCQRWPRSCTHLNCYQCSIASLCRKGVCKCCQCANLSFVSAIELGPFRPPAPNRRIAAPERSSANDVGTPSAYTVCRRR